GGPALAGIGLPGSFQVGTPESGAPPIQRRPEGTRAPPPAPAIATDGVTFGGEVGSAPGAAAATGVGPVGWPGAGAPSRREYVAGAPTFGMVDPAAAAAASFTIGGPDAYGPAAQAWTPAPPQPSGRPGGTRAPAAGRGEDSAGAPPAPPAPPSPPRS